VFVPCTVFISHRHSRRIGKYRVTIARPGEDTADVRELAADAELSYLLMDLGYTQTEVEHILKELEGKKASVQHTRSIDEFTLHDNGF
jgi:DNA-binding transcriptional regulator YhcF (GntR family)